MPNIPLNIEEYLQHALGDQPDTARLVVVLDPERNLSLENSTSDLKGRIWPILPYGEDDLGFRRTYRFVKSETRCLIWITGPPGLTSARLDLSYIPDVVARADAVLDLSLSGILRQLLPGEKWPETLPNYAKYFKTNFPCLLQEHAELRMKIGGSTPLNTQHLRALALCCRHPELRAGDMLFLDPSPEETLRTYLRLLFSRCWTEDEQELLSEMAQNGVANVDPLRHWFTAAPDALAVYLYLRAITWSFQVPNAHVLIQGLGVLSLDASAFEPQIDSIQPIFKEEKVWKSLIKRAEAKMDVTGLFKVQKILPEISPDRLSSLFPLGGFPPGLLLSYIAERLDELSEAHHPLEFLRGEGVADIVRLSALQNSPFSESAVQAQALLVCLWDIAERLSQEPGFPDNLGELVEGYRKSGNHQLELLLAKARRSAVRLGTLTIGNNTVRHSFCFSRLGEIFSPGRGMFSSASFIFGRFSRGVVV